MTFFNVVPAEGFISRLALNRVVFLVQDAAFSIYLMLLWLLSTTKFSIFRPLRLSHTTIYSALTPLLNT